MKISTNIPPYPCANIETGGIDSTISALLTISYMNVLNYPCITGPVKSYLQS